MSSSRKNRALDKARKEQELERDKIRLARKKAKREQEQREREQKKRALEQKKRLREREKKARAERRRALSEQKRKLSGDRRRRRQRVYAVIKKKLKNPPAGFDYRNSGFLPRVTLLVRGDRASIAGRLSSAGVKLHGIDFDGGETAVKIAKKDLPKAIAILDEMCYTYKIGAHLGVGRTFAFAVARAGLTVGALLSAVCMYVAYGYIWRVRVSGNETVSLAAVTSALNSVGIGAGCKKSDLTKERIAAAIAAMDGTVDASFETVGTTLYVRVLEATDHTVHTPAKSFASRFDATVTRVVVRSGTALVKRGDVVKKGDVLANGDVYSSVGELLYTADCDAEVYGNVVLTFSATLPTHTIEYRRTGRSAERTVFELFGLRTGKSRSPYASYETVARTANYDVLLPLYVTRYTYFETEPTEVELTPEQAAQAFAAAKVEELRFTGDFDASYKIVPSAGGLFGVHLFLSGEALISDRKP